MVKRKRIADRVLLGARGQDCPQSPMAVPVGRSSVLEGAASPMGEEVTGDCVFQCEINTRFI